MILVVDASVIVKWLLSDPDREADTDAATALMQAATDGQVRLIQPMHWLAEIAAVLARLSPETAEEDVSLLQALQFPSADDPSILSRACRLAIDLRQHVFDTLYHAVALERPDTMLVTADEKYLRASRGAGRILHLRSWKSALSAD